VGRARPPARGAGPGLQPDRLRLARAYGPGAVAVPRRQRDGAPVRRRAFPHCRRARAVLRHWLYAHGRGSIGAVPAAPDDGPSARPLAFADAHGDGPRADAACGRALAVAASAGPAAAEARAA